MLFNAASLGQSGTSAMSVLTPGSNPDACFNAVAGSSTVAGSTTGAGPTGASSAAGEGVSLEDPATAV